MLRAAMSVSPFTLIASLNANLSVDEIQFPGGAEDPFRYAGPGIFPGREEASSRRSRWNRRGRLSEASATCYTTGEEEVCHALAVCWNGSLPRNATPVVGLSQRSRSRDPGGLESGSRSALRREPDLLRRLRGGRDRLAALGSAGCARPPSRAAGGWRADG